MQRSTSGGLLALLLAVAACGFAAIALAAPPQQLCSGGPIRVTEVFLRRGLAVPSFAITDSGDVVRAWWLSGVQGMSTSSDGGEQAWGARGCNLAVGTCTATQTSNQIGGLAY